MQMSVYKNMVVQKSCCAGLVFFPWILSIVLEELLVSFQELEKEGKNIMMIMMITRRWPAAGSRYKKKSLQLTLRRTLREKSFALHFP